MEVTVEDLLMIIGQQTVQIRSLETLVNTLQNRDEDEPKPSDS